MIRPNPSRTHTWRHAGPRAAVHAALREDRRSPARERTRRPGLTSLIRFLVVASVFALGDATCRSGSSTASGLEGKPARSVGGVVRRLQRGRDTLAWRWANEERVSPWDRRSRAAVRASLCITSAVARASRLPRCRTVPVVSSSRPSAGTARREVDLDVERREAGAAAGGGLCTAAAAADFASRVFRRAWSAL